MKHLKFSRLMAISAVAMALALGGCGGSSGTKEEEQAMEVEQTPEENAVSLQVAKAINAHSLGDADVPAEFGRNTATGGADPNGMVFARVSGNAMITPFQTTADKKNNPFAVSAAQSAGTGWTGQTFTRSDATAKRLFTEMATVYTDIEMASDGPWETGTFPSAAAGSVNADTGVVTFGTTSDDASRFSGGFLPSGPGQETVDGEIDENESKPGTFYGVSGDYVCTTTTCKVVRDEDDQVTITGIQFNPDEDDPDVLMAKYSDSDTDYTYFGYWMESTEQRDGTETHAIETFHGGAVVPTGRKRGVDFEVLPPRDRQWRRRDYGGAVLSLSSCR